MSVLQVLTASAVPMSANRIARACGMALEDAYAELIGLEAAGRAQVVVTFTGKRVSERLWKARTQ